MSNQKPTPEELAANGALEASLIQCARDKMLDPPPGRVRLSSVVSSGWDTAKPVQAAVDTTSCTAIPLDSELDIPLANAKNP